MNNVDNFGEKYRSIDDNLKHSKEGEVLSKTLSPRLLEHGKLFFKDRSSSEFINLKYSQGMDSFSKECRDSLPVSQSNLVYTVTYGYWLFRQSVGIIQTVNLTENLLGGSGTDRPFVQKRIGFIESKTLLDIYKNGMRPLSSVLVDAYPDKKPYLLNRYNSVQGQTDEKWQIFTEVNPIWKIHQDEMYRALAIRAAEAVLAKQLVRIKNPVVLEHRGEIVPQVLPDFIDTVNVLVKATNPCINTVSAINTPSLNNYSNVDLVIRDINVQLTEPIYPSYILNRNGNSEEVLPGHYSTPAFKEVSTVSGIYDHLHESTENWVKNHKLIFAEN